MHWNSSVSDCDATLARIESRIMDATSSSNSAVWKPGQSGNPAGKRPGTRHRVTIAMEALLDGEAEALTRKAIELALTGDMQALKICMDRLCPPRKDRPVTFDLPKIMEANDAVGALRSVISAVSEGVITPSEAGEVSKLLDAYVHAIEVSELSERISKLEKDMAR